ncbi:hypothetical protein HDU97_000208 [Phlyctochytrium planicorne]|nr:hypothetical protein HDU97_000208 [Phlyctochytrium planicorne]
MDGTVPIDSEPIFSYTYFTDRRHERHGTPTDPSVIAASGGAATGAPQGSLVGPLPAPLTNGTSNSSNSNSNHAAITALTHDWRMRERLKTVSVALVLCLNIGIDPPDIVKTVPCAKLEAWVDPLSLPPQKALEAIGRNLQQQYEIWQPRARYRLSLDPSVEETRKLCVSLRRNAKDERILFHYNGHGVPKPTSGGEIWVFNKNYTQYIPVTVYDIQTWLGAPCIYVLDCSNAGNILEAFNKFAEQREKNGNASIPPPQQPDKAILPLPDGTTPAEDIPTSKASMKDCIQLAACGPNEILPMNPDLPADLFSCCLTTPIEIALRWFVSQNPLITNVTTDMIMKIPGRLNDRRTPLGELNWIFTAITDTIAWNVLPHDVFKRLFRQDLMVAALFRNFLLAERIMRCYSCTPMSYPALPSTFQHPMWSAWDLAAELCISQLPGLIKSAEGGQAVEYRHSNFFSEQLTAFEIWLSRGAVKKEGERGGGRRNYPEQLPIVLQVLLSQVHRLRALMLLSRFLDLGSWSVTLALSVGIFPYVLKLLQSPAAELKPVLVFIWAKILAVDPSCQTDLLKDNGYTYFVSILSSTTASTTIPNLSEHRAMCCFILAVFCNGFRQAQEALLKNELLTAIVPHLEDPDPLLRQWACLCAAKFWENHVEAQVVCAQEGIYEKILFMLSDPVSEVRAAAVYALGTLVQTHGREMQGWMEGVVCVAVMYGLVDASPIVRKEVVVMVSRVFAGCEQMVVAAAFEVVKEERRGNGGNLGVAGVQLGPVGGPPSPIGVHAGAYHQAWRDGPVRNQKVICGQLLKALLILSVDPFHHVASMAASVVDAVMYRVMVTFGPHAVFHGDGGAPDLMAVVNGSGSAGVNGATQSVVSVAAAAAAAAVATGLTPSGSTSSLTASGVGLRPSSASGALKRSSSFVSTLRSITGGIAGIISSDITPDAHAPTAGGSGNLQPPQQQQLQHGGLARSDLNTSASSPSLMALGKIGAVGGGAGLAKDTENGVGAAGAAGAGGVPEVPFGTPPVVSLNADEQLMPLRSVFFEWSLEYFTEPQMKVPEFDDPGSKRYNERLWRKERNDRVVLDTTLKHDAAGQKKFDTQVCFLHSDNNPGAILTFHSFEPHLAGADQNDGVIVYNWKEQTRLSWFSNSNPPGTSVTFLKFINEEDAALLVTGSSDGAIRIYRKYDNINTVEIVSAWKAIKPPSSTSLSSMGKSSASHRGFLLADWQQTSGSLIVSGEPGTTRIWDVEREVCSQEIRSKISVQMTSLFAEKTVGDLIVCGYADGQINVYDKRMSSDSVVMQIYDHKHSILSAQTRIFPAALGSGSGVNGSMTNGGGMELSAGSTWLISGDVSGRVQMLDLRQKSVMWAVSAVTGKEMTAFTIHESAPLFACGTASEFVWMYNTDGKPLSTIRHNEGFLGPRIGHVGCMAFHPYQPILGEPLYINIIDRLIHASSTDSIFTQTFRKYISSTDVPPSFVEFLQNQLLERTRPVLQERIEMLELSVDAVPVLRKWLHGDFKERIASAFPITEPERFFEEMDDLLLHVVFESRFGCTQPSPTS